MPALMVDGLLNPHLPVLGHSLPPQQHQRRERQQDASSPFTLPPPTATTSQTTRADDDTLPNPPAHDTLLAPRQSTPSPTYVVIPSTYGSLDSSPSPGVVVGIVLGSVAGFLLLLFLLYSALGFGPVVLGRGSADEEIEVSGMAGGVGARSVLSFRSNARSAAAGEHKHHRHSHRRERRGRATEMFEVRTRERVVTGGGSVPRAPIVVDARPGPGPPPPPGPAGARGPPPPRVVPTHTDDEDDEVVVIEEHSPPPPSRRRESRRRSRAGSAYRYRDVDVDDHDDDHGPPPPPGVRHVRRESSRRYSSSREYSRER